MSLRKSFEHLLFRVTKPLGKTAASNVVMVHPRVEKMSFLQPYNLHLTTGRVSWKLHVLPEYWIPAEIAQYKQDFFCPEDPRFHVIVSPQKIHQVPSWMPIQIELPREDTYTLVVYGGLTQDKFVP
jgi:hypothetical protein